LAEAGAEAADQNSTQQPATKEHCVVGDLAAEEAAEAESGEGSEAEAPAEAAAASANGSGSDTVVHPPPVPGQAVGAQGEERPSRLAPSTPAAARAGVPLPPLPPLDTSEFHSVNRPTTPPIPDYYLSSESIGTGTGTFESIVLEDEPKRSRVPFAVAGVLVAVFAVILIATQIGGSSNEPPQNGASAQRDARDRRATSTSPRNPEINRPAVTISVLNGTDTAGLANLVSDKLTQAGFTDNTPGNRNDGTNHASSTVYYASGSKLEAQEVARELKIKDVKEADEQTLAAGGSVPVIVVLGADLAQ
jgi:hypothetical protein